MITNATILRLDAIAPPTPAGVFAWSQGPSIACKCAIREGIEDKATGGVAGSVQQTASVSIEVKPLLLMKILVDAMNNSGQSLRQFFPPRPEMRVLIQSDLQTRMSTPPTLYRIKSVKSSGRGAVALLSWTAVRDA
jgi:hypothetical protein